MKNKSSKRFKRKIKVEYFTIPRPNKDECLVFKFKDQNVSIEEVRHFQMQLSKALRNDNTSIILAKDCKFKVISKRRKKCNQN